MIVRYLVRPSPFGEYAIAWRPERDCARVCRIFLSNGGETATDRLSRDYPGARHDADPAIGSLTERIDALLSGEAVYFDPHICLLEECSEFQRRVLLEEYRIPRGRVDTYARIASRLGSPRGARAVGGALAHNPFPLVIPCHRAMRTDGGLGGFQGGLAMKRALLAFEGVRFAPDGRIEPAALPAE